MKGKITISKELCKGCTFCVTACPKKILRLSKEFNSSGYFPAIVDNMELCTGCAMCAEMCPEIAIEVWREQ
ncbi:MAG: 4Fe-4S dicluster domain-containing protein [Candidatus Magnetominusculus sp. LBB02]|nr:4Fe-4S dicluster domain-containing protein [Candidatus Magnetominusculus sp. LBB02]